MPDPNDQQYYDNLINEAHSILNPAPAEPSPAPAAPSPSFNMLPSLVQDTGIDLLKGAVDVGQSVVGLANVATGNLAGKGMAAVGYSPEKTNQFLSTMYSQERMAQDQTVNEAKGFLPSAAAYVQNPRSLLGGIAESAPGSIGVVGAIKPFLAKYGLSLLAAQGLEAGTPEAIAFLSSAPIRRQMLKLGATLSGVSEGAQQTGQLQEQGREGGKDWSQTVGPALASGTLDALISMGSGRLPGFKDVPSKLALAMMPGDHIRTSLLQKGANIAKDMFKEGVLQEMPQSWQEQIFTNLAMGKPWNEGLSEAAAQGLMVGTGQGGGMSGLTQVLERGGRTLQNQQQAGASLADIFKNFPVPGAEQRVGVSATLQDQAAEDPFTFLGTVGPDRYNPNQLSEPSNMLPSVDATGREISYPGSGIVPPAVPLEPNKQSWWGYNAEGGPVQDETAWSNPVLDKANASSSTSPAVDLTKTTTPAQAMAQTEMNDVLKGSNLNAAGEIIPAATPDNPVEMSSVPIDLTPEKITRTRTPRIGQIVENSGQVASILGNTTSLENVQVHPMTGEIIINDPGQTMAAVMQPAGALFNASTRSWTVPPSKATEIVKVLQAAYPAAPDHPAAQGLMDAAQGKGILERASAGMTPEAGQQILQQAAGGMTPEAGKQILGKTVQDLSTLEKTNVPIANSEQRTGPSASTQKMNDMLKAAGMPEGQLAAREMDPTKFPTEQAANDFISQQRLAKDNSLFSKSVDVKTGETVVRTTNYLHDMPAEPMSSRDHSIAGSLAVKSKQGPPEGLVKTGVNPPTAVHRSPIKDLKKLLGAGDRDKYGNIIHEAADSKSDIGERRRQGQVFGDTKAVPGLSVAAVEKLGTYKHAEIRGVVDPVKIRMSGNEAFWNSGRTAYKYNIDNHYDANADTLKLWPLAHKIVGPNPHLNLGVVFSNLVKQQGYSGYVFNHDTSGNERWAATFSPVKVQENLGQMAAQEAQTAQAGPAGEAVTDQNVSVPPGGNPVTHEQLQDWADTITPHLPKGVSIEVARDLSELPRLADLLMANIDPRFAPYGYMDHSTGTCYLISSTVTTDKIAHQILAHELVSHHGLREMLGQEKFDQTLKEIYSSVMKDPAAFEDMLKLNKGYRYDTQNAKERLHLADEFVAKISETSENPSWFQDIISGIRSWLRDMGLKVEWTDQDIRALLRKSSDYLFSNPQGSLTQEGGQLSIKVFHGTGSMLRNDVDPSQQSNFMIRQDHPEQAGTVMANLLSDAVTPASPPADIHYLANGKSLPLLKDLPNNQSVHNLWAAVNSVVRAAQSGRKENVSFARQYVESQLSAQPKLDSTSRAAWTDLQNFYASNLGTIAEPKKIKVTTEPTDMQERMGRFALKKSGPLADNSFYKDYLLPYMEQAKKDIDMAGPPGLQAFIRNNRPTVKADSDRAVQGIAKLLDEYSKTVPQEKGEANVLVAKEKLANWKAEVDATRDFVKRFKETVDVYRNIWTQALEQQAGKSEAKPEGRQEYTVNGKPVPNFSQSNSQAVQVTMEKISNLLKILSGQSSGKRLYAQLGVQKVLKNVGKGELGSWRPGLSNKTFGDLIDLRKWYYDTFGRIDWRNPPEKLKTVDVKMMSPGEGRPGNLSIRPTVLSRKQAAHDALLENRHTEDYNGTEIKVFHSKEHPYPGGENQYGFRINGTPQTERFAGMGQALKAAHEYIDQMDRSSSGQLSVRDEKALINFQSTKSFEDIGGIKRDQLGEIVSSGGDIMPSVMKALRSGENPYKVQDAVGNQLMASALKYRKDVDIRDRLAHAQERLNISINDYANHPTIEMAERQNGWKPKHDYAVIRSSDQSVMWSYPTKQDAQEFATNLKKAVPKEDYSVQRGISDGSIEQEFKDAFGKNSGNFSVRGDIIQPENVTYKGDWKDESGKVLFQNYTDNITHGDFGIKPGEDLRTALLKSRQQFVDAGNVPASAMDIPEHGQFALRDDLNGTMVGPNDRWYSQPLTLADRFKGAAKTAKGWWKENITPQLQHFKELDYSNKSHLPMVEYLRQAEEIPRYGRELVGRFNQRILNILKNPQDRDTFEHIVILRDMLREATIGTVFSKGPQQVSDMLSAQGYSSLKQLRDHITHFESLATPAVNEVLNARKIFWDRWRQKAVNADILPASVLSNDDYFHHQVKEWESLNEAFRGTAPGMHKTKKSFQKARTGYSGEYNLNYFASETGVLVDLITQVNTARSLESIRINTKINVLPALVAEADRLNAAAGANQAQKETWKTVLRSGNLLDQFGQPITEQLYDFYKPVRGNFFHKVLTLTERSINKIMEEMQNVVGNNPTLDELMDIARLNAGTALATGLRQPLTSNYMVIQRDIIHTMENFQKQSDPTFLGKVTGELQGRWKQWVLFNPFRVTRYLLNNTTGDADIAYAFGGYKLFTEVPSSFKMLYAWAYKDSSGLTNAQRNTLETLNRKGVLGSGITVQEVPDLSESNLQKLINDPSHQLIKRWFKGVHQFNNFRENIMRLATWQYMTKEAAAGRFEDMHYGASKKAEIDAIDSMDDKIVKMSRELIGDYGNLSFVGQRLRKYVIPFWSWMEINAPRYFHMMKNEIRAGNVKGGAKVAALVGAKFMVKAGSFAALVMIWNFTLFRKEEEEMRRLGRDQLHLILGRRDDGSIISLRIQGSFSDTMSWLGLENLWEELRSLKSGRVTPGEEIASMAVAPIKRFIGGVTPLYKTAAEALTGKSLFPEPFAPRPIRDKFQHIMKGVGMDWITDRWVSHKPAPPLFSLKSLAQPFLYITDTHEAAYFYSIKMANDWLKDQGHERSTSDPTPKSNALYYWKQASKLKDKEGEAYYKAAYMALGGKPSGMAQSIKHTDPLVIIPIKLRSQFLSTLGEDNKKTWRMGVNWWQETYRGMHPEPDSSSD